MKTKSLYITALAFLFTMVSFPLYGAEFKTIEGTLTGEIVCLYEWTTEQSYQGSDSVCTNPRHDRRSLLTKEGDVYIMVADEGASNMVMRALSTDAFERSVVIVKGEIVEGGPIKIVKVRSLKMK